MKLLSLGDDAAAALVRHKGVAEPLLETYGASAVKALASVSPQSGRRLAILSRSGDLAKIGRTEELMGVMSRFGDKACDFVYRNKGGLLVGAVPGRVPERSAAIPGRLALRWPGRSSRAERRPWTRSPVHVVAPVATELSREAARKYPLGGDEHSWPLPSSAASGCSLSSGEGRFPSGEGW